MQSALNELVVDIDEIEGLEDELSQFNLFEALRIQNQEIRHSNFLSWLLDPSENHKLGDLVLRRFLQRAVFRAQAELPVTPVDFDEWNLSDALVRREVSNVHDGRRLDVLILSENNKLAVLLENKVRGVEGRGQLKAYRERLKRQFPDYRHLLLFLTVDGDDPSDDEYVSVSYGEIADLLEGVIQRRVGAVSADCEVGIRHYVQLLRRHFVADSKLAERAQRIYRKHRLALEYIFEQKPDVRSDLRNLIEERLRRESNISVDDGSKGIIRFIDSRWDKFPKLREGSGRWTNSKRMLLVEILNQEGKVRAVLTIGPGPDATRSRLYGAFTRDAQFKTAKKEKSEVWTRVWSETLVARYDSDVDAKTVFGQLEPKLDHLISIFLPKVTELLSVTLGRR